MAVPGTKERKAGLSWEEVCSDPHLRNLPYKIETNQRGQILMSPTYLWHGNQQARIAHRLRVQLPEGEALVEAAIQTSKGTKVADVAWFSAKRWEQVKDAYDAPVAPEICVEVLSSSNTPDEIEEKKQLYFEAGAEEVWICGEKGAMTFFDPSGALASSRRAPSFPPHVEL